MAEEEVRTCSTRTALGDMLETASRQLGKAQRIADNGRDVEGTRAVEQAKVAIESLTRRLAAHRELHHC